MEVSSTHLSVIEETSWQTRGLHSERIKSDFVRHLNPVVRRIEKAAYAEALDARSDHRLALDPGERWQLIQVEFKAGELIIVLRIDQAAEFQLAGFCRERLTGLSSPPLGGTRPLNRPLFVKFCRCQSM